MIDPLTPVIVGVGQASQRPPDPADAAEPADLLAEAVRTAEADAGAGLPLVTRASVVAVCDILSWRYHDPGAVLARKVGAEPRLTVTSTVGGNSPQMLVGRSATSIARGEADVVLVGGVECMYSRLRARSGERRWLEWSQPDDPPCPEVWGDDRVGSNEYETVHGIAAPTLVYPLFETALRTAHGWSVDEHRRQVADLWSGFARVAAGNPHAWSREPWTADQIREPTPDNRMVTFPYTKRMCANLNVDQAAALVMCSYGTAVAAGVAPDRLVFPIGAADVHDHFYITERDSLARAPGIGVAGRAALAAAGRTLDDVARFDLYSCFPSAVRMAMDALGLQGPAGGDARPLTVTGGLAFAGGPGSNYPTHSIAAMVDACRADPGSTGLITALGWYATKHSVGVYSATPSPNGFRAADPAALQAEVDRGPRREPAGPVSGPVEVEATAVVVERDGTPSLAVLAGLDAGGRRALAVSRDPDLGTAMTVEAWEGRTVRLTTDGTFNTFDAPPDAA